MALEILQKSQENTSQNNLRTHFLQNTSARLLLRIEQIITSNTYSPLQ